MASIVSFDSKEFHAGRTRDFFAILGLGLRWESRDIVRSAVTRAMRTLKAEFSFSRKRELYCFSHIKEERPFDYLRIVERFTELIQPDILEAFFVYSAISPSRVPKIFSQAWRGGMDTLDFIHNILLEAYPILCAWAILRDRSSREDCSLWLDHFQGHDAADEAWRCVHFPGREERPDGSRNRSRDEHPHNPFP